MKKTMFKSMLYAFVIAVCAFVLVPANIIYGDTTNAPKAVTITDTQTADINGDGKPETIIAEFTDLNDETGEGGTCVLKVNEKSITLPGYSFEKKLYVVDIDKSDSFKEIGITDNGPSSDYTTHFYCYGTDISDMGKVPGTLSGAKDYVEAYTNKALVDTVYMMKGATECAVHTTGNGKVIGTPRGKLFQTWMYFGAYKLDREHKLYAEKQSFYEAIWKNRLTTLKNVTVYGADKKTVIAKLKKGDKVIFWGSDEKAFCKIKMKNGKFGWIKTSGIYAEEYFSGVFLAD